MMILFSSQQQQQQLSQASGHLYVSNPEYNENLLHDNSAALLWNISLFHWMFVAKCFQIM